MSGTRKSITMLSNTAKEKNVTGDAIKADSYYGYTDGQHTVQFTINNFTGGIGIQGTLSLDPKEEDWFWIRLSGIENFDEQPFIDYPKDPNNPTGAPSTSVSQLGDTGTEAYTFTGNFTYLRAAVTRDHVTGIDQQPNDGTWLYGQVDRIIICL